MQINIAASSDKKIRTWSMEDFSQLLEMEEGLTSPICKMALTEENTFLLIGMIHVPLGLHPICRAISTLVIINPIINIPAVIRHN